MRNPRRHDRYGRYYVILESVVMAESVDAWGIQTMASNILLGRDEAVPQSGTKTEMHET